jgi:hypothetical protein
MSPRRTGRPKGRKDDPAVDEYGLTTRERHAILGDSSREGQTRGFRALRAVCKALGVNPLATNRLRGEESRLFHWMWTEEMMRLARVESRPFPWNPEWDRSSWAQPVHAHQRRRTSDQNRSAAA